MKRFMLIAALMGFGILAFQRTQQLDSTVTVTNARAVPMGGMFMVTLDMENRGAPVALTEVSAPSGAEVSVMNMGNTGAPLVIPGGGTGQLAMDGAHVMLSVPDGDFEEGTFQSLSLSFDDGSETVARVMRTGMSTMRHGMANAVEVTPAPGIAIQPPTDADPDGFPVDIAAQNFDFVRVADDAGHVAGQGHAHIYLNGLKLGRLYETRFEMGALSPGDYSLRVALNTNDHRPYAVDGAAVEDVWNFSIP